MSDESGLRFSPLTGIMLAIPAVGFLCAFFLLPVLGTARVSVYTYAPRIGVIAHLTNANYQSFLGDPYYLHIFTNTLRISVLTTFLCAFMGFPLAYWISRATPLVRSIALAGVLVPLLVSDVVRTYGWTILLADTGVLPQMLSLVHLPVPQIMRTDRAVIVGLVEVLLPFLVLPTVGSIASIPIDLEEAARSLGAAPWTVLLRVVLPLALPGLAVGSALVFILSMGAFVTPSLMGGPTVPVLGTLIYDQATNVSNWPFASAVGIMLLVAVLLLLAAVSNLSRIRIR